MRTITRTGLVLHMPRTSNPIDTRLRLLVGCGAAVVLAAFLMLIISSSSASAQAGSFTVMVGAETYVVEGASVKAKGATEPPDEGTIKKARFAARVLDEHILRSEINKVRFSAASRAEVYAAAAARPNQPWEEKGPSGDIDQVKRDFKDWASSLSGDTKQLGLALARLDFQAGIRAYRDSAAIYRKVMIKKEVLTYEEALRFYKNEEKIQRIPSAQALEARLSRAGAGASQQAGAPGETASGAGGQPGGPNSEQGPQPAGQASDATAPQQTQGQTADSTKAGTISSDADAQALQSKLQSIASDTDKQVASHADLAQSADQIREVIASEPAVRNSPDVREYAAANDARRSGYQQREQAYREAAPTPAQQDVGTSTRSDSGPILGLVLPSLGPAAAPAARPPSHPRYAQRPSPRPVGPQNLPPSQRQKRNDSTITDRNSAGVTGTYRPITAAQAQTILRTYKSIPGGVTLEGASPDLNFINSVKYEPKFNALIFNEDLVYLNPVSAKEFSDIVRALTEEDRMGVSLTSSWLGGSSIVYGKLAVNGTVAMNLKLADKFLGGFAWGEHELTKNYIMAPGYEGRQAQSPGSIAVYFNVSNFRFTEDPSGEVRRSGVGVNFTLVPLSSQKNDDGGHIPDYDRIAKGDVPPEYVANVTHLQDNFHYYSRERIVRMALAYGEAAAVVRSLKARGVDVVTLAKAMDGATSGQTLLSARPSKSEVVAQGAPLSPSSPPQESAADVGKDAAQAWGAVRESNDVKEIEIFLGHYGTTFYGDLARNRLEKLKQGVVKNSPPDQATPSSTADQVAGTYSVSGTNVRGGRYGGKATIVVNGNSVVMSWRLRSGENYRGHGTIRGDVMSVDWGDKYPVIYRLGSPDGVLRGTWGNGRGSEVLTPD